MAYQGVSPYLFANNLTNVQLLDDISGLFNGSVATFNLTIDGVAFRPEAARGLFIVLGGIVQDPDTDYTVSGSQITFTTAPASGLTFAGRNIYGLNAINNVNDGVITPAKLTTGGPSWDTSGNLTISGDLIANSLGDVVNLASIDKNITDTAVDVFVYDTRKDSDGGAWRKRTQHTSWYNETLNTSTRGSRREFPAVAVIVGTSTGIIIYDGDDPDMPMWLVSNFNSSVFWEGTISGISALNGKIAVACYPYDLYVVDMIKDNSAEYNNVGSSTRGPLSLRNTGNSTIWASYFDRNILARGITDVTLTLLPNAEVDSDSGLPIPTIIASCRSGYGGSDGVSIIKDNRKVSNITNTIYGSGYWDTPSVFDTKYIVTTASGDYTRVGIADIETATHKFWITSPNIPGQYKVNLGWAQLTSSLKDGFVLGGTSGLNSYRDSGICIVKPNIDNPGDSMHCHINAEYNSGYQVGDIKGAFLSDTDATNAVGTELHPNGNSNFSSTDVSYISNTASGTATVTSGQLVLSGGTAGYSDHIITVNTEVGARYIITIDYIARSAANSIGMYVNNSYLSEANDGAGYQPRNVGASYTWYFTADATTENIDLVTGGTGGATHTFDNWSIKKVEEDRSVNAKGLQVFGTVTKSPVAGSGATAAELVGYGPFSSSNYLVQPYNSDLDFGTGDFSIIFWAYRTASSTQAVFQRGDGTQTYLYCYFADSTNQIRFSAGDTGTSIYGSIDTNKWTHIIFVRRGGTVYGYKNGVLQGSNSNPLTTTGSGDEVLVIGRTVTGSYPLSNAKISLFRFSATTPSEEQIKKIYEDEKVLFQENSACTLYGSSDAVTALAYDDSTNLLHVGTSSGRSDFQGLRRINNTTTAVTTAISASNGLIAEQ